MTLYRAPFYAGTAKGMSDFGILPPIFPSPSKSCPHDLGGLKLLAISVKDASKKIIGVKAVRVNCRQCVGTPHISGKNKGKIQTKNRAVSIKSELPAAQALFVLHGASLFKNQGEGSGDEEASEEEVTGEGAGGGGGGGGAA